MNGDATGGFRVARERTIAAPCERVFAALTDPEQIMRWWGDDAVYRMTNVEQSRVVGGLARYTGRFVDGVQDGRAFAGYGVCREVRAPSLLEYTRLYPDGIPIAEKTVIRYELERCEAATLVRVTHSGFATEAGRDLHAEGWERVLEWLDRYLMREANQERLAS